MWAVAKEKQENKLLWQNNRNINKINVKQKKQTQSK